MDDIPVLSLIHKGSKEFPRIVIARADELRNVVYWTGSQWSGDEDKALIFADVNAASWVVHDVLIESVSERPCHRFVAPVYLEFYGDQPDLDELREWLERNVRIVVKSMEGPNNTVGVVIADFEKTEKESDSERR